MSPLISIIIPSYNQGGFIEETLSSIIEQDYKNFEIIIIDACSTDNTLDIINKYSQYVTYWISEPDSGQSHALNKGLRKCKGDFIGWMNTDDLYLPGVFEDFVSVYNASPDFDIYYSNVIQIDKHGNTLKKKKYTRAIPGFLKFYAKYRGIPFCSQSTFFKRSLFERIGDFDERLHLIMDEDYFYRCLAGGMKCRHIDNVWGAWRRHEDAKCNIQNMNEDPRMVKERSLFSAKHEFHRGRYYKYLSLSAGVLRRLFIIA